MQVTEEFYATMCNTRLGLVASGSLRYLFEIEDLRGRLPPQMHGSYSDFLGEMRKADERKMFLSGWGEYADRTLYEILGQKPEGLENACGVKELLEKVVGGSINDRQRLELVRKAIRFFRKLQKTAVANAQFPDTSIPQGVLELARGSGATA